MEKLLAIAGLLQRANGRRLSRRLIVGVMLVSGLTIVIAIMAASLLLGSLFAGYSWLVQSGLTPQEGMFTVGAVAVLITALLVLCLRHCLQRFFRMPKASPLTGFVSETLDAFIDGLTEG
jgi:hypothetical protein